MQAFKKYMVIALIVGSSAVLSATKYVEVYDNDDYRDQPAGYVEGAHGRRYVYDRDGNIIGYERDGIIESTGRAAGDVVEGVGEAAGDVVEGIGAGIGHIFGN